MANLSWWPIIIHWYPTGYYLHYKNSKTIYVTCFIQHSSPCVLWSNIPVMSEKEISTHQSQPPDVNKSLKVQWTESNPKVPITLVVT